MPRRTSLNICVFPSLEHSTWCVHKLQTILGLLCVPLVGTQTTDGEMPSLCQTKHNRAKPMSELSSALFSIADDNEFRFARFYIVCEAVPLGAPESPLIVCVLSDTPRGLSKRGKTQNSMFDAARKKSSDFASKNCRLWLHSGTSYSPIFL